MLLSELIRQQAAKIGLQDNAELAGVLARVGTTEIPDDLANQINMGLMSLDGAKNNPALQNHFKPTILNPVDDQFKILAEKYGISDTMAAEKSTYKKAAILEAELARRLAEAESKNGKKDDVEITNLQKTIADLQAQLADTSNSHKVKIEELNKAHAEEQLRMLVDFELSGKNYANKQLDRRVSVLTAHTLLDEALRDSKAVIVNDGGTLRLKQSDNPAMDYVDSGHQPVKFKDYVDKLLADNHLLEVSKGTDPIQHPIIPTPQPGGVQVSDAFQAAMEGSKIS